MRIVQGPSFTEDFSLDGGGSDIVDGALVELGQTVTSNKGHVIISSAAGADAIGVKLGIHDFSADADSTPEDGLINVIGKIEYALPGCIIAAEYADAADDDVAVASSTSTVVTITSLEDDIDYGWLFCRAGTGVGQLGYLVASASGNCTLKNALTTQLDSTSLVIKILPVGHRLLFMNPERDLLASQAAVGTFAARIVLNQVRYKGSKGWETLNPVTDHDRQLDGLGATFRSLFTLANSHFTPID